MPQIDRKHPSEITWRGCGWWHTLLPSKASFAHCPDEWLFNIDRNYWLKMHWRALFLTCERGRIEHLSWFRNRERKRESPIVRIDETAILIVAGEQRLRFTFMQKQHQTVDVVALLWGEREPCLTKFFEENRHVKRLFLVFQQISRRLRWGTITLFPPSIPVTSPHQ